MGGRYPHSGSSLSLFPASCRPLWSGLGGVRLLETDLGPAFLPPPPAAGTQKPVLTPPLLQAPEPREGPPSWGPGSLGGAATISAG